LTLPSAEILSFLSRRVKASEIFGELTNPVAQPIAYNFPILLLTENLVAVESDEWDGNLTPADMRLWLKTEVAQVQVASRRRIMEATALVENYEKGGLTPEEADRKLDEYQRKWGDLASDRGLLGTIEEEGAKISGLPLGGQGHGR